MVPLKCGCAAEGERERGRASPFSNCFLTTTCHEFPAVRERRKREREEKERERRKREIEKEKGRNKEKFLPFLLLVV
jgi:hypothetical protein